MKHALVVAYHYPPECSSSGVLRTLKFTRYLAEMGWRTTVLSIDVSAYEKVDPALAEQIPEGTRVVRTKFVNTRKHLSIKGRYPSAMALPDTWIGWSAWAIPAGLKIIKEDPVDLIFSTHPYATAHIIASALKKRSGLPWVADYRDPWYYPGLAEWVSPLTAQFSKLVEPKALAQANAVVTTTQALRIAMLARNPELDETKFKVVPNGYDEADFAHVQLPEAGQRGEVMNILHAGNIYKQFRNPMPLFESFKRLADAGELDLEKIRIRFFDGQGDFSSGQEMQTCLQQTGLADQVEFLPRIPYSEALQALANADLLLLMQMNEATAGSVPVKMYEYLRVKRPQLAMLMPGAASEILDQTGGGWWADPVFPEQIDRAILAAWHAWQSNTLEANLAADDKVQQFERRNLSCRLRDVFDEVVP